MLVIENVLAAYPLINDVILNKSLVLGWAALAIVVTFMTVTTLQVILINLPITPVSLRIALMILPILITLRVALIIIQVSIFRMIRLDRRPGA